MSVEQINTNTALWTFSANIVTAFSLDGCTINGEVNSLLADYSGNHATLVYPSPIDAGDPWVCDPAENFCEFTTGFDMAPGSGVVA